MATSLSWIGAFGVLLAFALNVLGKVRDTDYSYILLNALGSACLGISAYLTASWAFVIINIVWTSFAIYSLLKKLAKPG